MYSVGNKITKRLKVIHKNNSLTAGKMMMSQSVMISNRTETNYHAVDFTQPFISVNFLNS